MDCSWLVDDDSGEDPGSESDPEETQTELEARLYAIVHHCDLSQPLPPELAKHYSIQCGDDGKLTVALNESLENIKSEEVKKVDIIVKNSESDEVSEVVGVEYLQEKDDEILITESQFNSAKKPHNRFRYSDVNLDLDVQSKINITNESSSSDVNYSNLNYFKITPSFLNKKNGKKLKDLVIPTSFQTDQSPNWKDAANESFISVGADSLGSEKEIIEQMVCALKKANPKESTGKLYFVARALFNHNRKKHRKIVRRKKNKARGSDKTLDISLEEKSEIFKNECKESLAKHSSNIKNDSVSKFGGSISLNISPFKPQPATVDLVSEDEIDNSNEIVPKTTKKWKSLPEYEIPSKWSKKMAKFYTKPSSKKMKTQLNDIFNDLRRSTTDDDWKVDPRDAIGVYQRKPLKGGKYKNRRCPNCHQFGHLINECPDPRKVPTCFLCGQNYHTAHSCPNKICLKCGVYMVTEAYECPSCYYYTFNYDTPCGICGQTIHRTEICPDLWRSFHATVEGDKKVPNHIVENKRKYCCNCASRGHFSHQCPFPSYEGEQISSFVTNYSASPCEKGTTDIVIPSHFSDIVDDTDTDRFLQRLSNSTNAVIDVEEEPTKCVIRVSGTFEQCRKVRNEIEGYMNTRKRKRQEPSPKRKRRKMR